MKTFSVLCLALAAAVSAAPNDVWSPRIIQPNAATVWTVGQTYNVTWDTSGAPEQISNGAAIALRNETQLIQYLAEFHSFSLRDGFKEIIVPDVAAGTDYRIVLFGDSGNWSDKFAIVKDAIQVNLVL
ncbi:hypothetical protein NQ176_g3876 [Zarea fungicola]|uniref:Uncharacterized protein n=1 Tax=Zarea fungicola TaxID=93591 RepID=A0ACC1NGC7_9HYPO|nr:hypothetical protein NQ176_g3876 [Lecanicillium fungicola]